MHKQIITNVLKTSRPAIYATTGVWHHCDKNRHGCKCTGDFGLHCSLQIRAPRVSPAKQIRPQKVHQPPVCLVVTTRETLKLQSPMWNKATTEQMHPPHFCLRYMSALATIYSTSTETGQDEYGENFLGIYYASAPKSEPSTYTSHPLI